MGFSFVGDPNIDPTAIEKCPRGTYACNGIKKWITKDDKDIPIYEYDTKFYNDLVAKFELTRVDGETGPAWSGTALDLTMLALAFGGDVTKLPKKKNTTEFLVAVDKMIQASYKTITVDVGDAGWVAYIKEATPPEGYYQFKVASARNEDGADRPYVFQPNDFSVVNGVEVPGRWQVKVFFEIVGNMIGNPTPFDGFRVMLRLSNGFQGVRDGLPDLLLTANGGKSVNASRIEKFCKIFTPEVFDNYTWKDLENPIDEILELATKNEKKAVGQYTFNNPKAPYKPHKVLDIDSLAAVEEENTASGLVFVDAFAKERPMLTQLAEWLDLKAEGAFVTYPMTSVEDISLSPVGKVVANKEMVKLFLDAGIEPRAAAFSSLTEEECEKLLAVAWGNQIS